MSAETSANLFRACGLTQCSQESAGVIPRLGCDNFHPSNFKIPLSSGIVPLNAAECVALVTYSVCGTGNIQCVALVKYSMCGTGNIQCVALVTYSVCGTGNIHCVALVTYSVWHW